MARKEVETVDVEQRAKHTWAKGEVITAALLNTLETNADTALSTANAAKSTADKACPKTQAANKTTLGLVKQSALVAEAAGENVTKAEFKALLDALKTAGIMASA